MKKTHLLKLATALLLMVLAAGFYSCSNDKGAEEGSLEYVVSTFFEAVAADDVDTYTAMISGWDELDENRQDRIIQSWKSLAKSIEEGGGLTDIKYSRITMPLELVLENESIEQRQPFVYEEGQWKIRP